MKLLVHACCGPCSLEPTRILAEEGHDLAIAYINPNIHPDKEYVRRLDALTEWARSEGIAVMVGEYDPDVWEERVGVYGTDRASRCRACYALRLERTARLAAEEGFDGVTTTLSVSPWQMCEVIGEELFRAASNHGVEPVFRDFRPRYPEATRRSRELGMYRQNYCGCHFSDDEAAHERELRKAAVQAAKLEKRAAREKAESEMRAAREREAQRRAPRDAWRKAAHEARLRTRQES